LKTTFNKNLLVYAICLGLFSWSSCKENTVIPPNLIPPVDNIHTFGLDASSFNPVLRPGFFDSARTDDYTNYYAGIGKISNDPFFGRVTAGLYVQFTPPSTFFSFPDSLTLDSANISIPYYRSYGDTSTPINNFLYLDVYRVNEPFNRTDDHYSFQALAHDNVPVGNAVTSLAIISDVHTSTDSTDQLRIHLDYNFAQSIVQADKSNFNSPGTFLEFLKGLYIVPKDTSALQDFIAYFNMAGDNTHPAAQINFYMHNSSDSVTIIHFPFNTLISAFFTHIKNDYNGVAANTFVAGGQGRDSILVQGYPGFYTDIQLNNLTDIPSSIINKAQLVITALPVGGDDIYSTPLRLYIEKVRADGTTLPIADLLGSDSSATQAGLDFINGYPETVTINGSPYIQYQLNFPQELQNDIMAGDTTLTLRIRSTNIYPGAFRMLAAGLNGNAATGLKVNVIYTKFK
jgi:hypothetical protein